MGKRRDYGESMSGWLSEKRLFNSGIVVACFGSWHLGFLSFPTKLQEQVFLVTSVFMLTSLEFVLRARWFEIATDIWQLLTIKDILSEFEKMEWHFCLSSIVLWKEISVDKFWIVKVEHTRYCRLTSVALPLLWNSHNSWFTLLNFLGGK